MSLKAFVYHHLYVCDEFKLMDEAPSDAQSLNKGYNSETSESSTLSRRWSVRLLNYLKKHEDPEEDVPSKRSSISTTSSSSAIVTNPPQEGTDEEDYSEENQATVTLQNLLLNKNIQDKPRTVVGLFSNTTDNLLVHEEERYSSSSGSSPRLSDGDPFDLTTNNASLLNFQGDDLDYFGQTHLIDTDYEVEDTESSSEEEEKPKRPSRRHGSQYSRSRKPSDVGPDGVSYTERRGRRYLQEKMKVYGDDQTIVVVSSIYLF